MSNWGKRQTVKSLRKHIRMQDAALKSADRRIQELKYRWEAFPKTQAYAEPERVNVLDRRHFVVSALIDSYGDEAWMAHALEYEKDRMAHQMVKALTDDGFFRWDLAPDRLPIAQREHFRVRELTCHFAAVNCAASLRPYRKPVSWDSLQNLRA